MRNLKIALSILFVLSISFFVVRACVHKKPVAYKIEKPSPVAKKKITYKKTEPGKEEVAKQPAEEKAKGPRMAIILDDWGNNLSFVKLAIDIGRPVTLSILPHLIHSKDIDAEAYKNNLGVMLHMPMQPKNKLKGIEPHTIMINNSEKVILMYLDSALENVPHAAGVNNHMGSAATSDERVMNIVLAHLVSRGLFFIDSNTDATTVAPRVAKGIGIRFSKRDVFLDNEMNPEAIKKQLRRGMTIALRRGHVVVIGHDKKMTLLVIKEMVPEIEKSGIQLVLAKDLVG